MQSTRWHLAADSPSANGHYHLHDDSDLDKHGDLIPVPEMFDSELNEATAERMSTLPQHHPDYERLVGNIEQKRKALEQRYPPTLDYLIFYHRLAEVALLSNLLC
ncbi:hypothetical protein DFQ27_005412 [Actinomortierella ambigua]|uniref:Uncharacterized protein n=1 Tax=Actinomortierella ambigua TaxID=1343610 RepID=A0A9P6U2L3_9FUNG|nr:hypothetical protein DFQ27_005412 [Actinomortierella ambigua]